MLRSLVGSEMCIRDRGAGDRAGRVNAGRFYITETFSLRFFHTCRAFPCATHGYAPAFSPVTRMIYVKEGKGILRLVSILRDPVSGFTHFIAALLAVAGLVALVLKASNPVRPWHLTTYTVFGAGMILLYTCLLYTSQSPRAS